MLLVTRFVPTKHSCTYNQGSYKAESQITGCEINTQHKSHSWLQEQRLVSCSASVVLVHCHCTLHLQGQGTNTLWGLPLTLWKLLWVYMPDSAVQCSTVQYNAVHTNITRTIYGSLLFSAACFSRTYWPSPGRKMQVRREKCYRSGLLYTISLLKIH